MASPPVLHIVGWRERVTFTQWGMRRVRAKIDTGARTSAIDVAQIEPQADGTIRFEVVARLTPTRKTKWITARPVRTSVVKPSHGEAQTRYVCLTTISIGDHEQEIEVSLVCRAGMLCRMLIGRSALSERFLVDSSQTYLLTARKRPAPNGNETP